MEISARNKERSFCIEFKLRTITMASDSSEGVLIEGMLGELQNVYFAEGIVLELAGSHGIIRIDTGADEIKKVYWNNEKGGEKRE